jgi:hypothetical protein
MDNDRKSDGFFKLGLTDETGYERYLEKDVSATHILCDCKSIAYLTFRHLGQFLWNQVTTITPHKQSPMFYSKCRIDKDLIKGEAQ